MRRAAAAVLILLGLAGCATVNATMTGWLGHSSHELILTWGPPTSETGDGAGGTVLTYEQWVPRNVAYIGGVNIVTGGYTRTRSFYVRPDGTIYSWRWQGL